LRADGSAAAADRADHLQECRRAGATFACNTEYLSHVQDADGVTVMLQDRLTGREYSLRAKYLYGGDGARSRCSTTRA
jgi:2,4-dichlorophenol 6-monooxygenase